MNNEITRGDNFAGGIIKKGKMMLWERWEVREIQDRVIEYYIDEFVSPELYKDNKLVLLLPNPTFINLN